MANLSHIEKRIICDIAREAYDLWSGRPEFEQVYPNVNTFDAWRHREQAEAVGFRSLSHCDASHFPRLKSHFWELRRVAELQRTRDQEAAAGQQALF